MPKRPDFTAPRAASAHGATGPGPILPPVAPRPDPAPHKAALFGHKPGGHQTAHTTRAPIKPRGR
jgi:hypothetical protein